MNPTPQTTQYEKFIDEEPVASRDRRMHAPEVETVGINGSSELSFSRRQHPIFSRLPRGVTVAKFTASQILCLISSICLVALIVSLIVSGALIYKMEQKCESIWEDVRKYKDVGIGADLLEDSWPYPTHRKEVLSHLHDIALQINQIYFLQKWRGNDKLMEYMRENTYCDGNFRRNFEVHFGPWDSDGERFIPSGDEHGVIIPEHPPTGAGFYPEDLDATQFQMHVVDLPYEEIEKAFGLLHVVKYADNKKRRASNAPSYKFVPYSVEYQKHLYSIAEKLRKISDLLASDAPSLAHFLTKRADSLLSNDYYDSEVAWLSISDDTKLDITIGPYDVAADQLLNAKGAFEMHVSIKDEKSTERFKNITSHLGYIESLLPIDEKYKHSHKSTTNSIYVGDEIINAGYSTEYMSSSYNFPLDESIAQDKGTKRIVLKNVHRHQYKQIVIPLMQSFLVKEQLTFPCFDAYFLFNLAHELFRGLGPRVISVEGGARNTTVRRELKQYHDILDEVKAQVGGIFFLTRLIRDKKDSFHFDLDPMFKDLESVSEPEKVRRSVCSTFLVNLFRLYRLGGPFKQSSTLALNYLHQQGGITIFESASGEKHFAVNFSFIDDAVDILLKEVLTIQANGDFAAAKKFTEKNGKLDDVFQEMMKDISKDETIPVDLKPYQMIRSDEASF